MVEVEYEYLYPLSYIEEVLARVMMMPGSAQAPNFKYAKSIHIPYLLTTRMMGCVITIQQVHYLRMSNGNFL